MIFQKKKEGRKESKRSSLCVSIMEPFLKKFLRNVPYSISVAVSTVSQTCFLGVGVPLILVCTRGLRLRVKELDLKLCGCFGCGLLCSFEHRAGSIQGCLDGFFLVGPEFWVAPCRGHGAALSRGAGWVCDRW